MKCEIRKWHKVETSNFPVARCVAYGHAFKFATTFQLTANLYAAFYSLSSKHVT